MPLLLRSILLFILTSQNANANELLALTTIKPLHSLLNNIMQGVAKPQLLITDNQSIHNYQLRPSQRRLLSKAQIVFYANEHIESFIPALASSLNAKRFINLSKTPKLKLLPFRKLGQQHLHAHAKYDGHIWLSPANAKIIATEMKKQLSNIYPQYENTFAHNLKQLIHKLSQLQQQVSQQLQNIHDKPYVIFHDAWQYFENEFNLKNGHYVSSGAEHKTGIKHLSKLRQQISQLRIRCMYYEPPHIPKLIARLSAKNNIEILPLDPLALQYKAGSELYFRSIKQVTTQFVSCLSRQ